MRTYPTEDPTHGSWTVIARSLDLYGPARPIVLGLREHPGEKSAGAGPVGQQETGADADRYVVSFQG